MRSIGLWKRTRWIAALVCAAATAWADGIDDFQLLKAVPADVTLVSSTRAHKGQEWLSAQTKKVWEEFEKARLDRELKRILKAAATEAGTPPEQFDEQWQKVSDLAASVDWTGLCARESAWAMKMGFPGAEHVLLCMPEADKVGPSFDGLTGVLKMLAGIDATALTLSTDEKDGTVVHTLAPNAFPFPMSLTLARHKDVILIGFGPGLTEQTLAVLQGKGGESMAKNPRMLDALKKLPAPTDSLMFLDTAKLFSQTRELINQLMGMMPLPAPDSPEYATAQRVLKLPFKVIDMIDLWEYTASVSSTDGMKTTAESITLLRKDAKSRAMYPVVYGNGPIADPLKYVPQNASEFSVSSGIDLLALWTTMMKFIKEDVPDSEEMFAALDNVKTDMGIDIEKDVVSLLQGGMLSVSSGGSGGGDWAVMLKLRDEAKAKEMLAKALEHADAAIKAQGGDGSEGGGKAAAPVTITDATIEGVEGFKSLGIAQLAMIMPGKPTFGIKDGWFVLASSPGGVASVFATAAGKNDNFSKNERFLKEGLPPGKNVTSLSFSDDTKFGEEMGTLLGMVPMINMFAPDVAKNPVANGMINMVGKLGRVFRKMDYFLSSASQSTIDGDVVMTKSVTNYREPPAPKTPPAGESENKPPQ
jgi:Protein of unknown function (DUF3352)